MTVEPKPLTKKTSGKVLRLGLVALLFFVILASGLPWLVLNNTWFYDLGVDKSNEIGDTIGGILGPTVGLVGAALTFLAFWVQYDANNQQREQFVETIDQQKKANKLQDEGLIQQQKQLNQQTDDSRRELFENKLYLLLSIHRDNVNAMDLNKVQGRKVFLHLIDELRFIYWIVKSCYDSQGFLEKGSGNLTEDEIFQVAYLSFFFGIGDKSTPLVNDLGGEKLKELIEYSHEFITKMKHSSTSEKENHFELVINGKKLFWERVHTLGVGHLRRLSHYVRHLYQIVKFVDEQSGSLFSFQDKYDYVKTIRAQLSAHEQLFLYYNSLSVLGKPWFEKGENNSESYLEKYCFVKNMPLNLADFYKSPEGVLPSQNKLGKSMFEWTEIRERMEGINKK